MQEITLIHEGELSEKAKKNLELLKIKKEEDLQNLVKEYQTMSLPEKERMFPSDDDQLLR